MNMTKLYQASASYFVISIDNWCRRSRIFSVAISHKRLKVVFGKLKAIKKCYLVDSNNWNPVTKLWVVAKLKRITKV